MVYISLISRHRYHELIHEKDSNMTSYSTQWPMSLFMLCLSIIATLFFVSCEQVTPLGPCTSLSIPVSLEEGTAKDFNVEGQLCWNRDQSNQTLQVLSHGAGYGPIYWDFPYKPEIYSYVEASMKEDYATFNFARLGVGESSIPTAADLSIEKDAFVLHQVIEALQEHGVKYKHPWGKIVTVGHSMGSIITMVHAIQYPDDIQGIILTGFVHHVNAEYVRANIAMQVQAQEDPLFTQRELGEGYISSTLEGRSAFYVTEKAESEVITLDYETREPVSLSEIFGIRKYYDEGAEQLKVPVLQVIGDQDFIGCGTSLDNIVLDCTNTEEVVARERERFASQTCLETVVIAEAGHVLNLQIQAPTIYQSMFDWLNRRIGSSPTQTVPSPCLP